MIRKYKDSDLDALVSVWYDSSAIAHPFLDEAFVQKTKKDMHDIYIPNAETWLFEKEGEVLGFVSMLENEIGGLFVRPEQYSKGIGTQLVNYVNQLHVVLEVEVFKENSIGRAFYDKYGFVFMKSYSHEESGQDILRLKYSTE